MRWLFQWLLLCLAACVHCLSSSGKRLLAVIEESSEIDKYSQFWDDLRGEHFTFPSLKAFALSIGTGRGFSVTHESPKNEKLALIKHGVRNYDHVILFPPQSKGTILEP